MHHLVQFLLQPLILLLILVEAVLDVINAVAGETDALEHTRQLNGVVQVGVEISRPHLGGAAEGGGG